MLLAYTTWVTVWAREEASRHTCKGVDITIDRLSSVDSLTLRGVEYELRRYRGGKIVGAPINQVNTHRLRDYLSQVSTFESVECAMGANGRLNIHIVPMIPEIRVFEGDQSYYVNKDGKQSPSDADFYVDVPVVKGHFNKTFHPRDVLPLVRFVNSDPELSHIVSMYEAAGPHDLLLVPRMGGHVINFGDTTRLPEKKRALMAMYRKVMPYKGWEEYDTISVKFKGQVVATRRIKPSAPAAIVEEEIDLEETTLPEVGLHTATPATTTRQDTSTPISREP